MERRLAAIISADIAGFTRLMEADEEGTLTQVNRLIREVFEPRVAQSRGRIVKHMGDGMLMVFDSVTDAMRCALDIQSSLAAAGKLDGSALRYRLGVHLGDIMIDRDDIFGDGVNIAARLEKLANPGGIYVSRQVFDQVEGRVEAAFTDLGPQDVKNHDRPVHVYAVEPLSENRIGSQASRRQSEQEVRFCKSRDGAQIAYASIGAGPPIVKTANWLTHLQYDWHTPIWDHVLQELSRGHSLYRYDQRGNGLSDWNVEDISYDAFLSDLEAVVDAAGLEKFVLFGVSQGCAVSLDYAVRHPDRIRGLILYGGFCQGTLIRGTPEQIANRQALLTLMADGWGTDNPAFRQLFTSLFLPEGTPRQMQWFNELQRMSTSPKNAVRIRRVNDEVDVHHLLKDVRAPVLVMHCREDAVVPFNEGRRMAAAIPGARFVALEGKNHLFLEHEPAATRFRQEVRAFLDEIEQGGAEDHAS